MTTHKATMSKATKGATAPLRRVSRFNVMASHSWGEYENRLILILTRSAIASRLNGYYHSPLTLQFVIGIDDWLVRVTPW